MRTPPTTGEMPGVVKGGCHETRMVQRGPLDRASERRLRSCAGGRRIRQVAERAVADMRLLSEFKTVSTVIELTPEQFQFVPALYVALPPVSRTLPPGDKAVMANSGDAVMLALVADDQACARFSRRTSSGRRSFRSAWAKLATSERRPLTISP